MRLFKNWKLETAGPEELAPPVQYYNSSVFVSPNRKNGKFKPKIKKNSNSGFTLTKSISSMSRIMSQKWEKMTRSNTDDLSSRFSNEQRQSTSNTMSPPVSETLHPSSDLKSKQFKSKKPLQNLIKAFSWQDHTESSDKILEDAFGKRVENEEKCVRFASSPAPLMEKSVSEGTLNAHPLPSIDELRYKSLRLTRSIQEIRQQNQKLVFYLKNPALFNTTQGEIEVSKTLAEIKSAIKYTSKQFGSQDSMVQKKRRKVSVVSAEPNRDVSTCLDYTTDTVADIVDRSKSIRTNSMKQKKSEKSNEYESGYDTDNTRRGAGSPDSQVSTDDTTLLSTPELTDYEGVDLSILYCVPDNSTEAEKTVLAEINSTIPLSESSDWNINDLDRTMIVSDEEYELSGNITFSQVPKLKPLRICEIIGAVTKDGRAISALEMSYKQKAQDYDSHERSKSEGDLLNISKIELPKINEAKCTTFRSCEVIGAVTKDGRSISALEMKLETKIKINSEHKLKF